MPTTDDTVPKVSAVNFSWEVFFADPDGYKINFSSRTGLPEETLLSEIKE